MSEINHRARKVLQAVVSEYLHTGEAVGSRTVTRRGIDLSAATVRNVMSDLEEAGLLKQPHTSAGRVPTDQGLRFFVDSLLKVRHLSPKEREDLSSRYQIATDDLDGTLRDASRILSELSSHTVVLVTPRPDVDVLEHVEFVRLRENQLLVVLVTRSGQVQNKIVNAVGIEGDTLERMNNYLNEILSGLTLEGVVTRVRAELASERVRYQDLERRALELSAEALPMMQTGEASEHVIIEGQGRLIERLAVEAPPDEIQKMKGLFKALDDKRHLVDLLDETVKAPGIRVFIGAETQIEELRDFTVVAASYGSSTTPGEIDVPLGTLGVIGPTRMNYSKVINLVDFTAQILSGLIARR